MPANHSQLEKRLWDAADELRANSKLKSSEYSVLVLGLIFLRYADHRFTLARQELKSAPAGRPPFPPTTGPRGPGGVGGGPGGPPAAPSARPITRRAACCSCRRPPASARC